MKSVWIQPAVLRDFAAERTDAHRLCTAGDGMVERYGSDALISYRNEVAEERLATELCLWAETCAFQVDRIFARYLPVRNSEREAPRLLRGDADENLQTVATERSLRYAIDFAAGYSVGLFVDQRENRRRIRELASGAAVLNLFSYTCAFSLVAALGSARSTVSVDASERFVARM